jgi:uncharacterized OB-fold protein
VTAREPLDDRAVFDLFSEVRIDRDNIEHYRALAEGRLVINRCRDCGFWIYPHRPLCPRCLSWAVEPAEVSGRGRVFTFTLLQQVRDPAAFIAEPVVAAAVELAEQPGLRYLSRIVGCPPSQLTLDMPVVLTWIDDKGRLMPAFEPATPSGAGARG